MTSSTVEFPDLRLAITTLVEIHHILATVGVGKLRLGDGDVPACIESSVDEDDGCDDY